jgi:hypothetical protein
VKSARSQSQALCRKLHAVAWVAARGVCSATVGCSAATPSPDAPSAAPAAARVDVNEVERFLPLADHTVFSYVAWLPESPEPQQLILQVERRGPDRASLRSGNSVKRLEFVADGIRLVTGGYLLKAPLLPDAHWAGPAGRVRVTGMDRAVDVMAGHFVGCLETTEGGGVGSGTRSIITTYCPGVGIVKFSVDDGEREERFELKSFGPHVDISTL